MDYLHSIEAVIPGVRGQVLAALAANQTPQSARQVALLARVSPSRTGQVLDELAELGIVERLAMGPHVAVRLATENVAARWVLELSSLWRQALNDLREAAAVIRPVPLSLTVFGSFARGAAQGGSDVDVLAVHCSDVDDDPEVTGDMWVETLGAWSDTAGRITGNPVNVIDLALDEVRRGLIQIPSPVEPSKGRLAERSQVAPPPSWLVSAAREGVVLVGGPIAELHGARVVRPRG